MGGVLEQTDEKGKHYLVAFWSRVLTASQRRSWTPRTKEAYAIVSALRKWAGHIGLQLACVCTNHQSLRNWHTECVDTPSGPAAGFDRQHETFSKFNLSVVYFPGKDNTIADMLSRWVYPAGRALQDSNVSIHGDAKETELAKQLIAFERQWEEGIIDPEVKCLVVQSKRAPAAHMICSVVASVCPIACPYHQNPSSKENSITIHNFRFHSNEIDKTSARSFNEPRRAVCPDTESFVDWYALQAPLQVPMTYSELEDKYQKLVKNYQNPVEKCRVPEFMAVQVLERQFKVASMSMQLGELAKRHPAEHTRQKEFLQIVLQMHAEHDTVIRSWRPERDQEHASNANMLRNVWDELNDR